MLETAPEHGWTRRAIGLAAERAGLSAGEASLAAPGGPIELIEAFAQWADTEMAARLAAQPLLRMKIRQRVTAGIRSRLEALGPHKEAVRRAAYVLALPGHAPVAARIGWATGDRIWRAIGDTSTDFNHYSKRAILMGVQGATLARWLADTSENQRDTWDFLDRRIENVMQFEKIKAQVGAATGVGEGLVGMLARLRYGRGTDQN
jgi:ubiquinone biosynthesis protein COQ9